MMIPIILDDFIWKGLSFLRVSFGNVFLPKGQAIQVEKCHGSKDNKRKFSEGRFDIRFTEIVALEQERFSGGFRQCV